MVLRVVLRVVRKQKVAEYVVTAKLDVDLEARQVTLTAQGGSPWAVAYRHLARVRDDSNGVVYLTLSASRLPELRPIPWTRWTVSLTEWLIQTHSGKPTAAMQAPLKGEDDTASAAAVFAAISANRARALLCHITDAGCEAPDGAIPVSLVVRPPTDPRQSRQAGGPAVPEWIRPPSDSLLARRLKTGGKSGKGRRKGGRRSQPPHQPRRVQPYHKRDPGQPPKPPCKNT